MSLEPCDSGCPSHSVMIVIHHQLDGTAGETSPWLCFLGTIKLDGLRLEAQPYLWRAPSHALEPWIEHEEESEPNTSIHHSLLPGVETRYQLPFANDAMIFLS